MTTDLCHPCGRRVKALTPGTAPRATELRQGTPLCASHTWAYDKIYAVFEADARERFLREVIGPGGPKLKFGGIQAWLDRSERGDHTPAD